MNGTLYGIVAQGMCLSGLICMLALWLSVLLSCIMCYCPDASIVVSSLQELFIFLSVSFCGEMSPFGERVVGYACHLCFCFVAV